MPEQRHRTILEITAETQGADQALQRLEDRIRSLQEQAGGIFGGGGGGTGASGTGGPGPGGGMQTGRSGSGAHRAGRYGGSERERDARGRFVGAGGDDGDAGGSGFNFQALGRGFVAMQAMSMAGQLGTYGAGQVSPGYGGVAARQMQRIGMAQTMGGTLGTGMMMTGNPLLMGLGGLMSLGSAFFGGRSKAELARDQQSAELRRSVAERGATMNLSLSRASFQGGGLLGNNATVQADPFGMLRRGASLGLDPAETSNMLLQATTAGGGGFNRQFMGRSQGMFSQNLVSAFAAGIDPGAMGGVAGQFRAGGGFRQGDIGGGELMMGLIRSGQEQGLGSQGINQLLSQFTSIGQMMEEKGMKIAPESIFAFSEGLERAAGAANARGQGPFAGAQGMRAAQTMIKTNMSARDKLLSPFQGIGETMALTKAFQETGGSLVGATDLLESGGPAFAQNAVVGMGGKNSFLSKMIFRSMGFGGEQADVLATQAFGGGADVPFGGAEGIAAPSAPGAAVARAQKTLRQQQAIGTAEATDIIRSLANMEQAWVSAASSLEKYVTRSY